MNLCFTFTVRKWSLRSNKPGHARETKSGRSLVAIKCSEIVEKIKIIRVLLTQWRSGRERRHRRYGGWWRRCRWPRTPSCYCRPQQPGAQASRASGPRGRRPRCTRCAPRPSWPKPMSLLIMSDTGSPEGCTSPQPGKELKAFRLLGFRFVFLNLVLIRYLVCVV